MRRGLLRSQRGQDRVKESIVLNANRCPRRCADSCSATFCVRAELLRANHSRIGHVRQRPHLPFTA